MEVLLYWEISTNMQAILEVEPHKIMRVDLYVKTT